MVRQIRSKYTQKISKWKNGTIYCTDAENITFTMRKIIVFGYANTNYYHRSPNSRQIFCIEKNSKYTVISGIKINLLM